MQTLKYQTLSRGSHHPNEGKACMMEAVSFLAGEKFTDQPECVSRVIATFCRTWNDGLEQEDRDRLLLPLLQAVIGTRTTDADEEIRSDMAFDWLVRVHATAFLDHTPELRPHADALRSLSPVSRGMDAWSSAVERVRSAKHAAWNALVDHTYADFMDAATARDAAGYATGYAAGYAAGDAAEYAAVAAAGDAAEYAAVAAAGDAAEYAAGNAVRVAYLRGIDLTPTVATLQQSAVDLLKRMCAVGRTE
jgi:hypothetical protein